VIYNGYVDKKTSINRMIMNEKFLFLVGVFN